MRSLLTRSPANPEFARVIPVTSLRRTPEYDFDISPEPEEAAAVAALLGAEALPALRLSGRLSPEGDGWRLEATLEATAVQPCVVTLDPVTTRIDQPVLRRFQPMEPPRGDEVEVDALADDALEPLGDRIDLGLVAVEALALALPAYPRSEGAVLSAEHRGESGEEPVEKPFAALAALRRPPRDGS